jgi:hypothetical protein
MIYEANEPSSACRLWRICKVEMDRSVLESPPPSAFTVDGSFHAACPAETLTGNMIEWSFA